MGSFTSVSANIAMSQVLLHCVLLLVEVSLGLVPMSSCVLKPVSRLQAKAVDDALASGQDLGPLAGIPFAIKDNICLSEGPTTAGEEPSIKTVARDTCMP